MDVFCEIYFFFGNVASWAVILSFLSVSARISTLLNVVVDPGPSECAASTRVVRDKLKKK